MLSYCCPNKSPQIGWLKPTEVYSLSVLETEVQNEGAGRAFVPPKALGGNPSPLLQLRGAPDAP